MFELKYFYSTLFLFAVINLSDQNQQTFEDDGFVETNNQQAQETSTEIWQKNLTDSEIPVQVRILNPNCSQHHSEPGDLNSHKKYKRNYVYLPETNTFYKFHWAPLPFIDAMKVCQYEGGVLAYPYSKEEADYLISLTSRGTEKIWIGIHDYYSEGEFLTLDGVDLENTYHNWGCGQPTNHCPYFDCVAMNDEGKYQDESCKENLKFVCSKDASTIKYDRICHTFDEGYKWNKEFKKCYKAHPNPKTWSEARRVCKAEEAQLPVVDSAKEAKYLRATMKKVNATAAFRIAKENAWGIHIDLNDLFVEGEMITSEGIPFEQLGYHIWRHGYPDNTDNRGEGAENCGSLYKDDEALVNDLACDRENPFFCTKTLQK